MRRAYEVIAAVVVVCGVWGYVSAGALALAGGRVYEMVSPVYKGGFGALHIEAVGQDGEKVLYYSPGAFAGAPSGPEVSFDYVAHRGPSGWSTTPLMVPPTVTPYVNGKDVSPTLESVLVLGKPGANQEQAFQTSTEEEFVLHSTDSLDTVASWELAGMVLKTVPEETIVLRYEDASPDFCHILVSPVPAGGKEKIALLEGIPASTVTQLYELDRGCDGGPVSLKVVGLNNKGKVMSPLCEVQVGVEASENNVQSKFNAVADGGREVFVSTCPGGLPGNRQLYVRLDGSRTLEVSKPLGEACSEVPCSGGIARANAYFAGASEDGSTVFFTTKARLEPATDEDNGPDLYMAKIGCPAVEQGCDVAHKVVTSLVQVSHDPNGAEAGVQGVVRLAPGGSRAYFVAQGDLLDGAQRNVLESEGRAVPRIGADNLYVYDSVSAQTGFVGDLCSGKESSGVVEDTRCPSGTGTDASLWSETSEVEAQSAGSDGRFIIFGTYAQLVIGDTDEAKDVYRYDAVTGALERVSVGENGYHANGNDSLLGAAITSGHWGGRGVQPQYEMDNRAISEDGSRILFQSSEPLSPAAINGLTNVYEWHKEVGDSEGSVSLISGGAAEEPVEDAVISREGGDVFFVTTQGLVAQDTDGAPDLYDARLNGGFPVAPAPREPCSGDACQGALTTPAPLLVPGSVSQAPGENLTPRQVASSKAKKTKGKAKRKRRAKRAARPRRHAKRATGGRLR